MACLVNCWSVGVVLLGFIVSPTAVRHSHQFISSALVNAEREIGRALKTQVNHLIEKVAFFRAADFAPAVLILKLVKIKGVTPIPGHPS